MKVIAATASFWLWNTTFERIVDSCGSFVDGFEFHLGIEELNDFKGVDGASSFYNLAHLVVKPDEVWNTNHFESLQNTMDALNIKKIIIHPYFLESFSTIPKMPFSIENMDKRKASFQSVDQTLNLAHKHGFSFTFDVNHYEEIEKGSTDRDIDSFVGKIDTMHVSVPENHNHDFPTPHFLCHNSNFSLPKKLPRNVPWTIEGLIPKDDLNSVKREVEFFRNY